jgi:hypothetical protein
MVRKIEAVWKGLQILQKYDENIDHHDYCLYAGPDDYEKIKPEDRTRLEGFGWMFEDDLGWSIRI